MHESTISSLKSDVSSKYEYNVSMQKSVKKAIQTREEKKSTYAYIAKKNHKAIDKMYAQGLSISEDLDGQIERSKNEYISVTNSVFQDYDMLEQSRKIVTFECMNSFADIQVNYHMNASREWSELFAILQGTHNPELIDRPSSVKVNSFAGLPVATPIDFKQLPQATVFDV